MRDETKRKLDDLVSDERLLDRKTIFYAALMCLAFGGVFVAWKTTFAERTVPGKVTHSVWRIDTESVIRYPDIQVMLDEGRLVGAGTLELKLPAVGSRVVVTEKARLMGYHSYHWEGSFEPSEKL